MAILQISVSLGSSLQFISVWQAWQMSRCSIYYLGRLLRWQKITSLGTSLTYFCNDPTTSFNQQSLIWFRFSSHLWFLKKSDTCVFTDCTLSLSFKDHQRLSVVNPVAFIALSIPYLSVSDLYFLYAFDSMAMYLYGVGFLQARRDTGSWSF